MAPEAHPITDPTRRTQATYLRNGAGNMSASPSRPWLSRALQSARHALRNLTSETFFEHQCNQRGVFGERARAPPAKQCWVCCFRLTAYSAGFPAWACVLIPRASSSHARHLSVTRQLPSLPTTPISENMTSHNHGLTQVGGLVACVDACLVGWLCGWVLGVLALVACRRALGRLPSDWLA